MPKSRVAGLAGLVLLLAACSSGSPAASTPAGGGDGSQPTDAGAATTQPTDAGSATTEPTSAGQSGAPAGSLADLALKLVPDGATLSGNLAGQGVYQQYATSTLSLDQITAFYDQRIPSLGMTVASKAVISGSLYYSTTNPVGAIVVVPATDGSGGFTIAVSLNGG
ncbi:MAG: hypothetical protein ACRDF7_08365 [Candidatus Limnocylindrales bacterium]